MSFGEELKSSTPPVVVHIQLTSTGNYLRFLLWMEASEVEEVEEKDEDLELFLQSAKTTFLGAAVGSIQDVSIEGTIHKEVGEVKKIVEKLCTLVQKYFGEKVQRLQGALVGFTPDGVKKDGGVWEVYDSKCF